MNDLKKIASEPRVERTTPWILRGVLAMFVVLAALLGYALFLLGPTGKTAEVRIPRGAGASAVGKIMEDAGLVRSASLFALYLRFSNRDKALKPGFYRLEGKGLRAVAVELTDTSSPLTVKITIPEGWRASQIAQRLSDNKLDGAKFLELVNHPPLDLRPPESKGPTLEGFLFPATYEFGLDATPEEIIQTMTRRMAQEFSDQAKAALKKLNLSIQDWITLASIVQAEAGNSSERPAIAGIFLNRLDAGMPLQADPTVAYGLDKRLPELDRAVGDFQKDTPYNSYLRRGLPPGAIGNPGEDALNAVLEPKRTNAKGQPYLYFLHAQGRLFLNVDFQGHLRDTAKYYH
ncbi:MAG: endolytic transglycosylase MltG [Thermaceae bacterium]|nr:endolytic transglycosylase MltG [Thermaceae bacterium]